MSDVDNISLTMTTYIEKNKFIMSLLCGKYYGDTSAFWNCSKDLLHGFLCGAICATDNSNTLTELRFLLEHMEFKNDK